MGLLMGLGGRPVMQEPGLVVRARGGLRGEQLVEG